MKPQRGFDCETNISKAHEIVDQSDTHETVHQPDISFQQCKSKAKIFKATEIKVKWNLSNILPFANKPKLSKLKINYKSLCI